MSSNNLQVQIIIWTGLDIIHNSKRNELNVLKPSDYLTLTDRVKNNSN